MQSAKQGVQVNVACGYRCEKKGKEERGTVM